MGENDFSPSNLVLSWQSIIRSFTVSF